MTISTTPNRGYHWPNNDEPVTNGWDAIRDLAVDVDLDVKNLMLARQGSKAASQSFPNGTVDTLVTLDTYVGSTGILAPTSSRLAAPVAGTYRWTFSAETNSNLNAYYRTMVRKNAAGAAGGGTHLGQAQMATPAAIPAGYGVALECTGLVTMAINDYVEAWVRHNFAAALTMEVRLQLQYVCP